MPLKLAPRARLRRDPRSGETILLWPERGMTLNASAVRVVELLDGSRDLDDIVTVLCFEFPAAPRALIAADASAFLEALAARALIEEAP